MDQTHLAEESYQKKKKFTDKLFKSIFWFAGFLSAIFILLIIVFVISRGISPFLPSYTGYNGGPYSVTKFLSGMQWRQDSNLYGVLYIIINTFISALGALLISFPISVLTALFIVKIAPTWLAKVMTTIVELLAAIPSVVYGVFAAGSIVRWVQSSAGLFGQSTFGGNSLLAVAILLALMVFPTMTSLAIVAIRAVPKELTEGSLALGATKTQTNFKVVLTTARSGIFAGLILGLGRAFGEATAVTMVAGNAMTGPTVNPFNTTRTLTSTMLAGLKETHGLDYDIRFSVGIILMVVIIGTNLIIHYVKSKVGGSMS